MLTVPYAAAYGRCQQSVCSGSVRAARKLPLPRRRQPRAQVVCGLKLLVHAALSC